jgi:hypothetical protein
MAWQRIVQAIQASGTDGRGDCGGDGASTPFSESSARNHLGLLSIVESHTDELGDPTLGDLLRFVNRHAGRNATYIDSHH